jgi:hypothetical protein
MTATADRATAPPTNDPAAHALLREAHDSTYHFAADFAGFAASVNYCLEDQEVAGRARIPSPRAIEFDLAADEAGQKWIRQELASMVGHRWYSPYEQGDGRQTLTLGPDDGHPYRRLLQMHGDRFSSSYRVQHGQISQVNRTMGPMRFSIHIQARVTLGDGRSLPNHFTVVYWRGDPEQLARTDIYQDAYTEVDGVYLPSGRLVTTAEGGTATYRAMNLTGHTLLVAAPAGTTEETNLEYRQPRLGDTNDTRYPAPAATGKGLVTRRCAVAGG